MATVPILGGPGGAHWPPPARRGAWPGATWAFRLLAAVLAWSPLTALAEVPARESAAQKAAATTVVDVIIDLRAEIAAGRFDPQRDQVGLRGAAAPLRWDLTLLASAGPEPGLYSARLSFAGVRPGAQPPAYKFKIEHPGRPEEGWEPGRNRRLLLDAGTRRVQRSFGTDPDTPPPQRCGRIDRLAPRPSAHVVPREVQVWLPPGYEDQPGRRYPVLYLHDGQNVFDHQAAGAEWQVDEQAQRGVLAGELAPMIIVAVASGASRVQDYTPWPGRAGGTGLAGGGADAYARYLVDELKPLIDQRYRTRPTRESTAVGGSSLGGLVSMWLLLARAEVFGAALVVSPSVWWADEAVLAPLREPPVPALPPPQIWLDVGVREGPRMVDGARRLREALQSRGWPAMYLEQADGGHDEASWATRVAPMLRFLFGAVGPAGADGAAEPQRLRAAQAGCEPGPPPPRP